MGQQNRTRRTMGSRHGRVPSASVRFGLISLLGVTLMAIAVAASLIAAHDASTADEQHDLTAQAATSAAAISAYFDRTRAMTLMLAHDQALRQLALGSTASEELTRGERRRQANTSLAYFERLSSESIDEVCLIDLDGVEVARLVRGSIASAENLSGDETDNAFFVPTTALQPGEVHQSLPYVSSDTAAWVVSNSTPVTDEQGIVWGMLHVEVPMSSLVRQISRAPETVLGTALLDRRDGRVVSDTGAVAPDVLGATEGAEDELTTISPAVLTALVDARATSAAQVVEVSERGAVATSVDGRQMAVAEVDQPRNNANQWLVVVPSAAPAGSWLSSVGAARLAFALAALLFLGAFLNARSGNRALRRASTLDELTDLPNRRLLAEKVTSALEVARHTMTESAILLIDLDRFKEVNDTLGHQYGDQLLRDVAARLQLAVRTSDTVARLGADEFAVLLPAVTGRDAAVTIAERCVSLLHEPFLVEGVALSVEVSVGLAMAPEHGQDVDQILRAADIAMYEAKERKSGVVVYDPLHDLHTPGRLALLGDLRRALREGQLVMHYQPKVDLATGTVAAAEALVRWNHPERGFIPPGDFIPVVESTGLVLPLTLHTLELAVGQARRWMDAGTPIQVAVNLSPRCLLKADLLAGVRDVLERHELPARLLRLEITEGTVMADPVKALAILTELQQSGVALSLDDFGTGYSSMTYLKRLPVDELKIDRSFISDMLAAGSDSVLVRSSIDLGHNLGLSVVAEGVEDIATMEQLSDLGCDVVQGFYLARPMPAEHLDDWLAHRAAGSCPDVDAPVDTPVRTGS